MSKSLLSAKFVSFTETLVPQDRPMVPFMEWATGIAEIDNMPVLKFPTRPRNESFAEFFAARSAY